MRHSILRRLLAVALSLCMLCGLMPLALTASAADIAPIEADNFTILWSTDPQWYSFAYPEILTVQNEWVVNNANRMNILYTVHTGDFVDNPHNHDQWAVANAAYKKWDDAGMAYGVLAGNHDVDTTSGTADHTEFSQYFGEARYKDNWWYGGGYDDNYGHYDLMNLGGVNFIFVYLGYGPHTDADYAWMNSVLKEHEDYIAVLAFHEYMAASGERTSRGNTIFENVVLKNPNVRMVLCGHNYNSTRKIDTIDDNGDGKPDRTVYQMMANYQNTTNGGNGFMRFMECDVAAGTITHRTYSPYTAAFGSDYEDGTILDGYGKRDEFTIPFDFSAPKAKEASDPESGTVVEVPQVAFAPTDTATNMMFDAAYFNKKQQDGAFGVGVYDRTFTMNAADVSSNPAAFNYVVTKYENGGGHKVEKVLRGAWLGANPSVPVPHDGVVIAIPEGQMDVGVLGVGHRVFTKHLNGLADLQMRPVSLWVPTLEEAYSVNGVNRAAGNGEWVIYDSLNTSTDTHTWDMVFTFANVNHNAYTLLSAQTELGKAKTFTVPDGGFVLAVNLFGQGAHVTSSLRDYFTVGMAAMLEGHVPGSAVNATTTSLLPTAASDWAAETGAVAQLQDGAHKLYKTEGNWPALNYTFATPITVDPSAMLLCYDYMIETNARGSIILTFKNSVPGSASSKESLAIQSAFAGANISSTSGDVKGDDVRRTGKVPLSALGIPDTAYNADGTLTITGLRVLVSGTDASNMNKMITFYGLGISDEVTDSDVVRHLPLVSGEVTVSEPSKAGDYVYNDGKLTVTSNSADGYAVTMTLHRDYDVTALKNLLVDVESSVPFDIRPVFTTASGDASYGLVSDFWPQFCEATVNDRIPSGNYQKALDVHSCFTYNGVLPTGGITTVKAVEVVLGGQGTLTLKALQASNGTAAASFTDGVYKAETTPNTFLESDVYEIDNVYVKHVAADTTVQELCANVRSSDAVTVWKGGAAVGDNALVATGMIVKAGDAIARTVVVRGDVNGDGKASTMDGRMIVMAVLKVQVLDEAQTLAADFDQSGVMNTTDVRELLIASITG
ncbi:MAG: metallophosphoesterase [Clostridia bacterium]|nr:metallophosphoesterase [Clostridia bacterium]